MTAHPRHNSLNNPGPVMNPAKNPHRAGAPNHHQNGSGENHMVGNETQMTTHDLLLAWRCTEVAVLRKQNATLRAENEQLRGELDASGDAVLELLHDLEGGAA